MGDSRVPQRLFAAAFAVLFVFCVGAAGCRPANGGSPSPAPPAAPPAQTDAPPDGPGVSWAEIDELIEARLYQKALERVSALRQRAVERGDEADWTRALVRQTQLQTGLHGYETSVRRLRDTAWPERPLYRAVLDLYQAHSLVDYLNVYGWEIGGRERVESDGEVDLRSWTRAQIGDEIDAAYARVWNEREAWGDAPLGELAEYFEANDYPRRIRGTLRDAVTYLWVGWLADSSHWSAAEENGVYRLDLAAQLEPSPPLSSRSRPPISQP